MKTKYINKQITKNPVGKSYKRAKIKKQFCELTNNADEEAQASHKEEAECGWDSENEQGREREVYVVLVESGYLI